MYDLLQSIQSNGLSQQLAFSRLTMVLVRMDIVCTEQRRQGERAL
jgi:hypothetical protein